MIKNTKCECGHQNRVGTVLCEACGKPLDEHADSKELLEMRYDGVARRSQRANPNFIDKIWNFFSSVKVAIYLIIFTLIGAIFGTIFEQESNFVSFDPSTFYKDKYGTIGDIYYKLGLSHTYESWWFVLLLVMIGASLVICSLDRVLPLYKALSKQKIRKHMQFLTRQKVVYQGPVEGNGEEWVQQAVKPLKKKGYRVHTDGSALLAEKQRFSRWGPYVIHIGLIVFLLAVLFRGLPGLHLDKHYWFPEGEITKIPDTNLYLKNDKFTVEYYTEEEMSDDFRGTGKIVPKLFETKAILYECTADCGDPSKEPKLKEVQQHAIRVNDPLNYKGFKAYQFDFDLTPKLRSVQPVLVNVETGEQYGKFKLDMTNPQQNFTLGPYTLELKNKFMDFALNDQGQPISKSKDPNAPAFLFLVKGPDLPEKGSQYIYFPKQIDKERFQQDAINEKLGGLQNKLQLDVIGMEDVDFIESSSYLNIRIDRAMPYVWTGLGIVMLGLVMGFYWQHRRIWLRIDDGVLTVGGHTSKNWFGLRREVASFLKMMNVEVDEKQLDNGGNRS
ncbi:MULTISPECIES: cytochrome c biogenesis protein ResB [Paenibacillus]|uniref:Cytochrome c biogenesis protein ResB n=1 Tax=Paenibacillus vini TaxID=1476024 RepID=A0ABQ4M7U5_9BACL|nr:MULTISPECIES: cytochrome c biogenesis protein ResB [Paenibacillus]MBQ4898517.1 cytochrome c biogenesis protein ResB [Paenibacillus sp. Marseille-P2973]MDN4067453.1 cytochrome c biogenesis protein ResB [Paenibacillus vini]GIP52069.1 cytochrome c biogenesis protein ResB [Paenibacillus vini]